MFMHTQNIAPEYVKYIIQVLNLAMGNSSKVFQYWLQDLHSSEVHNWKSMS